MTASIDEFLGELRLGRQLTTAGQVAASGLILLLGLLFLLTGRAANLVGPWSGVGGVLAGVVFGLTLLNVLELLGGSSERGGTYILIHETLGGLGAFLAGWSILAGIVTVVAALARATADHIVLMLPAAQPDAPYIAAILFAGLIFVQLLQLVPRRPLLWPLAVLLLTVLAIEILTALPRVDLGLYAQAPPVTLSHLMQSAAWLMAGYVILEAVLASRRQIRDPGRDLVRALVGLLVATGLGFGLLAFVVGGLNASVRSTDTALVSELIGASVLPAWIIDVVGAVALILATNTALMTAARHLHALSREGALPSALRRVGGRFLMPPLLFTVLAAVTLPLILWMPVWWLIDLAASLFLVAMTLLNVAAIYSHRAEPERRRPFILPFSPLVPSLAIALNLALLLALSPPGIVGAALWLLLGGVVYLTYARRRQVEAQEGVVVFGRDRRRERPEGGYRILVPLSQKEERRRLLRLATALAHQLDGEVIPLQVIPMSDPLAIEEGRRVARERNTLFQWSTRMAEDVGVPVFPITRLAPSVTQGILETAVEEECNLILMPWAVTTSSQGARMGQVLDPVIRRAPCDVAVVAYHPERVQSVPATGEAAATVEGREGPATAMTEESAGRVARILVPTAGGPHAPLATRIALLLAREYDAAVTAIYIVDPEASAEAAAQGQERIQQTLDTMRQQADVLPSLNGHGKPLEEIPIETRVIRAEGVVAGIAETGAEYDLVLMGASEESLIDQVLFGSVPEQVARACPTPVVMVKRYQGLPRFWLQRTWDTLDAALPTLTDADQVEVYRNVRRGARPDADFFVMIGLSSIIATLGLLLNSGAVIIGAMLVAPLLLPIVALGLSIIRGDLRLLRLALEATIKGVALAIGLALVLAAITPLKTVTQEIAARTHPNLFDLGVAVASGAASAYATAREDVAEALPGVAIAAALVPPLSVIGTGLAMGDLGVAGGSALLFATNLMAIVLAGSVTFLLLGFRPAQRGEREVQVRLGLTITLLLVVLITVPLSLVFIQSVNTSQTQRGIQRTLTSQLDTMPDVELADFSFEQVGNEVDVTVTVYVRDSANTPAVARRLDDALKQAIHRPTQLRLKAIPITEVQVSQ